MGQPDDVFKASPAADARMSRVRAVLQGYRTRARIYAGAPGTRDTDQVSVRNDRHICPSRYVFTSRWRNDAAGCWEDIYRVPGGMKQGAGGHTRVRGERR